MSKLLVPAGPCLGIGVLGFGVWGLGFGVWGLGVGIGAEMSAGLGFRVWGLGIRD